MPLFLGRAREWDGADGGGQSAAKPDTEYSLFGGGVQGKYVSLVPAKEVVQSWALQSPQWPSGACPGPATPCLGVR